MIFGADRWRDLLDSHGVTYALIVVEASSDGDEEAVFGPDLATAFGVVLECVCPIYVSARRRNRLAPTGISVERDAAERSVRQVLDQLRQRDDIRFALAWCVRDGEPHLESGGFRDASDVAHSLTSFLEFEWEILTKSL